MYTWATIPAGWTASGGTREFQAAYGLEYGGVFGYTTEARIKSVIFTGEAPVKQSQISGDDWWQGIRYWPGRNSSAAAESTTLRTVTAIRGAGPDPGG